VSAFDPVSCSGGRSSSAPIPKTCLLFGLVISLATIAVRPSLASYGTIVGNVDIDGQGIQAVVTAGSTFPVKFNYQIWNDPACPGCVSQIVVGVGNTGQVCAYNGFPDTYPASTEGSVTVNVTAPSTPGTYVLHWTRDRQISCAAAVADYPNGVENEPLGWIYVGATDGAFSVVRHVRTNGKAEDAVQPGAPVTIDLDYTLWNSSACPGCIAQIVVGIDQFVGACVYSAVPGGYPGTSGHATFTMTAPGSTGQFHIQWILDHQFGCFAATGDYPGGQRQDAATIYVDPVNGVDDRGRFPSRLALSAAPNPFRRSTRVDYSLPANGRARITVHDLEGRRLATLVDGDQAAGRYAVQWNGGLDAGGSARPGVYYVRLSLSGVPGQERRTLILSK